MLLLESHFRLIERRDLGGGILHLVLKDIAHNFAADAGKPWLEGLFRREDRLLSSGEVGSDFVVAVFQVRPLTLMTADGQKKRKGGLPHSEATLRCFSAP